jgi:cytochrome P450
MIAGTELPANAISFGVFQIARNQRVLEKLQEELEETSEGNGHLPSLSSLEMLPYLDAVVKETLRLGNLVPVNFQGWYHLKV